MSQFIDGKTCDALSGKTGVVRDPSTGEVVSEITLAGAEDVDRAVQAARNAYAEWSRATPAMRSAVLTTFARLLSDRAEEIAQLESRIAGKPIRLASEFDVPGTIDNVAFFAGAARNLEGKATAEYSADHTSSIRREPVGVVGSISPWNYPLQMAAWKILPAIAAGNTIVLKPAELTPLTSLLFAEIGTEAGLPPGVVNVLTGSGTDCGAVLLRHPDVDMVSFTGSTRVGRTVLEAAATNAKRVHLELGGKAPFVVFDDADLTAAIHGAVAGSLINTGQDCTAATRAIVHRSLYADFVVGVADLYASVRLGPTADPATDLGPLISMAHREKVAGMVDRAQAYARVVTGGEIPGGELAAGSYYLADLDRRRRTQQRGGPRRGLRSGALRVGVRLRRGGDHAGQRHPVRAGRLGLDPGRLPGPAVDPRGASRVRLGQRPHPDHQRDAARRDEGVRLRQGHVELQLRRLHRRQARDVRRHRGRRQALAPDDLRRPGLGRLVSIR